jgi:hypothetical protein
MLVGPHPNLADRFQFILSQYPSVNHHAAFYSPVVASSPVRGGGVRGCATATSQQLLLEPVSKRTCSDAGVRQHY